VGYGIAYLGADGVGGGGSHHRTDRRLRVERVPQTIGVRQLNHAGDEFLVTRGGDVDPFDAATRLPGIEEGAVRQGFNGVCEVGVGSNIGRILAAELLALCCKPCGGGPHDRPPAGN
jgi:hypothetical protein